jgi:LPS export ABC transporter protein LptC
MNRIFYLSSSIFRFVAAPLIGVVLLLSLSACSTENRTVKKLAEDTSSVQNFENNLSFNDVTLEQANEQGQPVWKVKAKQATYSQDKKVAQIKSPTGELFQDGKSVYQISGQQGEIQQDGKRLFLKGQIVATDPKNGVVLRGNELEWRPLEDVLIVRNQLTGTHRQMQVVAQEARAFSRASRVELQGRVVANATDPALQLRTEHLIWQLKEQKLIGDRPLQIDRYKAKKITDRATANQGEVFLKTKVVTLKQNAQLALLDPPMQVASNHLSWNLNTETITANQPLRIVHHKEQMTVTAKQGRMDLQKDTVYLTGDVYAVGQRRQVLNSKTLTWYVPTKLVEAQGNVFYRQVEPPVSFTGQKAIGKLQDQSIVVSGGRVVTEIIP